LPTNFVNVIVRLTAVDSGVASRMQNITHSVRSVEGSLNRADGASRRMFGAMNASMAIGAARAREFREEMMNAGAGFFATLAAVGIFGLGFLTASLQAAANTQKEWSLLAASMGYTADKVGMLRVHYGKAMMDIQKQTGLSIGQVRDMWTQFKVRISDMSFKEFKDKWSKLIAGLSIMEHVPASAAANKLALALSGAPMGLRRLAPDIEKYVSFSAWRKMSIEQRKEVLYQILMMKGYAKAAENFAETVEGKLNIINATVRAFMADVGFMIIDGIDPILNALEKFGEWFRTLPKDVRSTLASSAVFITFTSLVVSAFGLMGIGVTQFIEFLRLIPIVCGPVNAAMALFDAQVAATAVDEEAAAVAAQGYAAAQGEAAAATRAAAVSTAEAAAVLSRYNPAIVATTLNLQELAGANLLAAETMQALNASAMMSTVTPGTAAAAAAAAEAGAAGRGAAVMAGVAEAGGAAASGGFFAGLMAGVRHYGGRFISSLRTLFTAPGRIVSGVIGRMGSSMGGIATSLFTALTSPLGVLLLIVGALATIVTISGKWGDVLESVGGFLRGLWNETIGQIGRAVAPMNDLKNASDGVKEAFAGVYEAIKAVAGFIGWVFTGALGVVFRIIATYLSWLMSAVDNIMAGKGAFQDWVLAITNPFSWIIWLLTRAKLITAEFKKQWEAFAKSPEGRRILMTIRNLQIAIGELFNEIRAIIYGVDPDKYVKSANTAAGVAGYVRTIIGGIAFILKYLVIPALVGVIYYLKAIKPVVIAVKAVFDALAWLIGRIVDLMEIIWTFFTKGPIAAMELAVNKVARGLGLGSQHMRNMGADAKATAEALRLAEERRRRLLEKKTRALLPHDRAYESAVTSELYGREAKVSRAKLMLLYQANVGGLRSLEAERLRLIGERDKAIRAGRYERAAVAERKARNIYNQERKVIIQKGAIQINAEGMSQKQVETAMYNVLQKISRSGG